MLMESETRYVNTKQPQGGGAGKLMSRLLIEYTRRLILLQRYKLSWLEIRTFRGKCVIATVKILLLGLNILQSIGKVDVWLKYEAQLTLDFENSCQIKIKSKVKISSKFFKEHYFLYSRQSTSKCIFNKTLVAIKYQYCLVKKKEDSGKSKHLCNWSIWLNY